MRIQFAVAAVVMALGLGPASGAGAADARCGRACLEGYLDQYLTAMTTHDASKAPLAKNVRYTENAVAIPIGYGLWKSSTKIGGYRITVADPTSGQIAYTGTILEADDVPALVSLRLKIAGGKITEVEQIVARGSRSPNLVTPRPVLLETVPPAERTSRADMIRIAGLYFDSIEQSKALAPFDPKCNRLENGLKTTNNPEKTNYSPFSEMGCAAQMPTRIWSVITKAYPRRYPVIDEERGLIWTVVSFQHAGGDPLIDTSIGKVKSPFNGRPFDTLIGEMFKIRDGKILAVEAGGTGVQFGAGQGWPG